METIEEENDITVLRRPTEYRPPLSWRTWLIGRPLPTADAPHQTIGKAIGLAVFAADALSSVAYAPRKRWSSWLPPERLASPTPSPSP